MRFPAGAALLVLALAGPAGAEDTERARVHFQSAVLHYDEGRYEEALREFEAAYRSAPKPALLYNIAQAYDKLGNLDKTIEYLRRYLDEAPDAPDRQAVEGWLRAMESQKKATAPPPAAPPPEPAPPPAAPEPAPSPVASASPGPAATAESSSGAEPGAPWYGKWWVWAGAGALVAGGVVAVILLSGSDSAAEPSELGEIGNTGMVLRW